MKGKLYKKEEFFWYIRYFEDMKGIVEIPLCFDDRTKLNSNLSFALDKEGKEVSFEIVEIQHKEYARLIINDNLNIQEKYIELEALGRFGYDDKSIDIFIQGVKWAIEQLNKEAIN